jgi:glycine betaine/proline transport system substrate-binding protein
VYDLTEVALPEVTEACTAAAAEGGDGYACDYPADVLYKAFGADLQTRAPEAFAFLSALSYDNASQEGIAKGIDVDGQDPVAAAQAWVDANNAVWQPWVDAALG